PSTQQKFDLFNKSVHHAVCDGFHVGRMLNELQQYCDEWQGGA
ncbi:CatA-like O-acetyltransferase, partial [Klebsiella quasipneumoniae]